MGNGHVAERVNVILRAAAGIAKVPHTHGVVIAIVIEAGIGAEQNRINCGTNQDVAKVGPVSCYSCPP